MLQGLYLFTWQMKTASLWKGERHRQRKKRHWRGCLGANLSLRSRETHLWIWALGKSAITAEKKKHCDQWRGEEWTLSAAGRHTHTVRLLRTHTRPTHTPTDTHRWNRDGVWHLKGKSWHWVHHCHCACHKAAANIKTFFICAALLAPEIVFLSVWYSPELRRRSLETAGCYQGLPTYWQLMVVFMYTCHSRVFNIPTLLMLPKIPVFTLRMAMLLTQKQQFSSFCEICQYEQKFLLIYTDMCIKPIHIFDPVVHFDLFMPPPFTLPGLLSVWLKSFSHFL